MKCQEKVCFISILIQCTLSHLILPRVNLVFWTFLPQIQRVPTRSLKIVLNFTWFSLKSTQLLYIVTPFIYWRTEESKCSRSKSILADRTHSDIEDVKVEHLEHLPNAKFLKLRVNANNLKIAKDQMTYCIMQLQISNFVMKTFFMYGIRKVSK